MQALHVLALAAAALADHQVMLQASPGGFVVAAVRAAALLCFARRRQLGIQCQHARVAHIIGANGRFRQSIARALRTIRLPRR